eukprot:jgi/Mesvir1/5138/Mv15284-RA.1
MQRSAPAMASPSRARARHRCAMLCARAFGIVNAAIARRRAALFMLCLVLLILITVLGGEVPLIGALMFNGLGSPAGSSSIIGQHAASSPVLNVASAHDGRGHQGFDTPQGRRDAYSIFSPPPQQQPQTRYWGEEDQMPQPQGSWREGDPRTQPQQVQQVQQQAERDALLLEAWQEKRRQDRERQQQLLQQQQQQRQEEEKRLELLRQQEQQQQPQSLEQQQVEHQQQQQPKEEGRESTEQRGDGQQVEGHEEASLGTHNDQPEQHVPGVVHTDALSLEHVSPHPLPLPTQADSVNPPSESRQSEAPHHPGLAQPEDPHQRLSAALDAAARSMEDMQARVAPQVSELTADVPAHPDSRPSVPAWLQAAILRPTPMTPSPATIAARMAAQQAALARQKAAEGNKRRRGRRAAVAAAQALKPPAPTVIGLQPQGGATRSPGSDPLNCVTSSDCPLGGADNGPCHLCIRGRCRCPIMYTGSPYCMPWAPPEEWCLRPLTDRLFLEPGQKPPPFLQDPHAGGGRRKAVRSFTHFGGIAGGASSAASGGPFRNGSFVDLPGLADFSTCAVVGSSTSMLGPRKWGAAIDAHTAVFRFNDAPTKGFEEHVGQKTTLRFQNMDYCGFRESPSELTIQYTQNRDGTCDAGHILHTSRAVMMYGRQYFLKTAPPIEDPSGGRLKMSGGFFGIAMALHLCASVDVYGFDSSESHYYDKQEKKVLSRRLRLGFIKPWAKKHNWLTEARCREILEKGAVKHIRFWK